MRMYACECASIAADSGHIENAEDVFHIKINCIFIKSIKFLVNEHMHYNEKLSSHDYWHLSGNDRKLKKVYFRVSYFNCNASVHAKARAI